MQIPKRLGKIMRVRLAAVILAMFLISPGISWSQGARPGSRVQSGPQQADKSFSLEQKKKRQQRLRNRQKDVRSKTKGQKQSSPATKGKKPDPRTKSASQPIRIRPLGPAGK